MLTLGTACLTVAQEAPPYGGGPKLLDRVRSAIRMRHLSRRTGQAYVFWTRPYILFHGKEHPATLGPAEVTLFLSSLAVEHRLSASTQNQALSALVFLYKRVFGIELPWLDCLVRAKRPVHVPTVLSEDDQRLRLQRPQELPLRRRLQSRKHLRESTAAPRGPVGSKSVQVSGILAPQGARAAQNSDKALGPWAFRRARRSNTIFSVGGRR